MKIDTMGRSLLRSAAGSAPNLVKNSTQTSLKPLPILTRWVRIVPILALLGPCAASLAGELVLTSGAVEWVGDDAEREANPGVGERLPDSGSIGSTSGISVLQREADFMILLDQGAEAEWRPGRSSPVVRPRTGLVVIHANRTTVESTGVTVEFGGRRFWIASGTAVMQVGEDGLRVSVLLRGRQFDRTANGSILMEISSPTVTMESRGTEMVFESVSELVRSDQVRIYRTAVRATEILTEQLRLERPGMRSVDLGAILESLRQLRFHLPAEKRLEINTVLVDAARREWTLQRNLPFSWPPILPIPQEAAPWDEALKRD